VLGSWTFIVVTAIFIAGWMVVNAEMARSFEAHPYILLNLVLACLTVLHASFVRMSQNRQAARDRAEAQHDDEVNAKAELEIAALRGRLDETRIRPGRGRSDTTAAVGAVDGLASRRTGC